MRHILGLLFLNLLSIGCLTWSVLNGCPLWFSLPLTALIAFNVWRFVVIVSRSDA